jgi:NAD(P)-dependent dehydrogenase (short-subunit alcohol dehydrogenase family)
VVAASEGALVNMTRTLANRWASLGINVSAIAPGYFPDQDDCASIRTRRRRWRR